MGGDTEEGELNLIAHPHLLPCGVTEHTPQGKPSPIKGEGSYYYFHSSRVVSWPCPIYLRFVIWDLEFRF